MAAAAAEEKKTAFVIGVGRLTWHRYERVTDRYGSVYLIDRGDSLSSGDVPHTRLDFHGLEGSEVTLKARVIESRQSTHIGDLFHGVLPSTPDVGEVVTLGTGRLRRDVQFFGNDKPTVAIEPADNRHDMWLDIKALYRCHEQTVELFVEVSR